MVLSPTGQEGLLHSREFNLSLLR